MSQKKWRIYLIFASIEKLTKMIEMNWIFCIWIEIMMSFNACKEVQFDQSAQSVGSEKNLKKKRNKKAFPRRE